MTDKEKKLRQIIEDFENRKTDGHVAVGLIADLTGETIDIGYFAEYWASEYLDTFIDKLLVEHIHDWQSIDDKRAIELIIEIQDNVLIIEIQDNVEKGGLRIRNSTALEKRYNKSAGTVINIIYNHSSGDPQLILDELKKETRIFL